MLSLLASVCILSGCIDDYEAEIPSDDSDLLVVEGAICSGQLNKFILTRTQPVNSSSIPLMVTGARVSVHGSDGSEYMTQETNGYYTCTIGELTPTRNTICVLRPMVRSMNLSLRNRSVLRELQR